MRFKATLDANIIIMDIILEPEFRISILIDSYSFNMRGPIEYLRSIVHPHLLCYYKQRKNGEL